MPINGVQRPGLLPIPNQGGTIRPMFRTLAIAASGLSAQRQRLETIAQNIANADVTSGPDGTPYKKRTVLMQSANQNNANFVDPATSGMSGVPGYSAAQSAGLPTFQIPDTGDSARTVQVPVLLPVPTSGAQQFGVAVVGIAEDQNIGRLAYEPGHPDADANGYVHYPDINVTEENVNMYDAKRMYEANASVFQAAKSMLRASLDI
ncbi:MAG: flagellar basal body rod C-terminal domain-containing protein [Gemmatimonadaceae bacterium]